MLRQRLRFELGQDVYRIDFGIKEVAEHEVDQPVFAPERNSRFGPVHGERIEAATFAAGHDHAQCIHIVSQVRPIFPGQWE